MRLIKTSLFGLLLSLLLGFMTVSANTNQTNTYISLDNFYQVSDDVYRSAQPSQQEMRQLKWLGIKTVINLRAIHSDRDEIEGSGLHSIWIKTSAGKINDNVIIRAMKAIDSAEKPVLIHCWHGSDRTEAVIAMYRMVFQGWTKQQAINELMQPQYGYHYSYYPNIKQYLENVDVNYIRRNVFNIKG